MVRAGGGLGTGGSGGKLQGFDLKHQRTRLPRNAPGAEGGPVHLLGEFTELILLTELVGTTQLQVENADLFPAGGPESGNLAECP